VQWYNECQDFAEMDLCLLYGIVRTLGRTPVRRTVFYEYRTPEDTRDQGTDIPADRTPRSILGCAVLPSSPEYNTIVLYFNVVSKKG
jgi:hypothetical protein